MQEYIRTDYLSKNEVDKYLAQGWEVIGTTNHLIEPNETRIEYHVGLPARVLLTQLRNIVHDYERFGFKEELFKKIAEESGEDITDYTTGTGYPTSDITPTYMSNYSSSVHNEKKRYYKEYSQEEIESKFIF